MSDTQDLMAVVQRELDGEATEEEVDALYQDETSLLEWRDLLVELLNRCETALTTLKAQVSEREQECRAMGPRGKDRFFRFKAEMETQRAKVVAQKQHIIARLRDVKAEIHSLGNAAHEGRVADTDNRLERIEEKLDRVLKILDRTV
jgi:hypothetical protein